MSFYSTRFEKIQLEKSIDNITDNELMKEFLEITETYTAKFITQSSFSKEVESLLINTFGNNSSVWNKFTSYICEKIKEVKGASSVITLDWLKQKINDFQSLKESYEPIFEVSPVNNVDVSFYTIKKELGQSDIGALDTFFQKDNEFKVFRENKTNKEVVVYKENKNKFSLLASDEDIILLFKQYLKQLKNTIKEG